MLDEARRRAARGADVVVGFVECHGRPQGTAALLDGLEIVPRTHCAHRGGEFEEMDLAAVLERRRRSRSSTSWPTPTFPEPAATPNAGGVVEELLAAGIDVITALNIQHLESLNDVVEKITRMPQRETVPDEVVRRAQQIEFVDITPEGLRRRMAHGNIYAPEKIDAALADYFRPGNLTALRQLALLWVADRVDEALQAYRSEHGIGGVWEIRERVVVALTGGPEGDTLIRRAARIADRSAGDRLLAVHVTRSDGLAAGTSHASLARQRRLAGPRRGATTRSSATTCPPPSSTSRAPRTPPNSSSAPAAGAASNASSPAAARARRWSNSPRTSTSTSSRTSARDAARCCPRGGAPCRPRVGSPARSPGCCCPWRSPSCSISTGPGTGSTSPARRCCSCSPWWAWPV